MYIYIKNKNIKKIKICDDISDVNHLKQLIKKKINLNKNLDINSFFLTNNSKLINSNTIKSIKNDSIISLHFRIKGGLPGFFEALDEFLAPILGPVADIAKAFVEIILLLVDFSSVFINLVEVLPNIFSPDKIIDDILAGVIRGVNAAIKGVISAMSPDRETNANEASEKERLGVFGVSDKSKAICTPASFIDLIILVLCPPLALFMKRKMKFFFQVLLCCLLTYKLYYFPGFIFAAVYILC